MLSHSLTSYTGVYHNYGTGPETHYRLYPWGRTRCRWWRLWRCDRRRHLDL